MSVHPPGTAVPRRPALSPSCRLVRDGKRYLVEQAGTVVTFEGRAVDTLLERLVPLLDGTRTVDELAHVLGPSVAPAIDQALSLLESHRLLVNGPSPNDADVAVAAALEFAVGVNRRKDRAEAVQALRDAHVAILGSGPGAAEAAKQLERTGVGRVDALGMDSEPPSGSFVLAAPCPDEVPLLADVNERALARGGSWLQLLPFDGRVVVAGPLFVPGLSACHRCYLLRRGACSGYEEDFGLIETTPVRAPSPSPVAALGASLATLVSLRWLATSDPSLPGRFYALDVRSVLGLSYEVVLRVPRCPACGPPPRAVPLPWFAETP